MKAQDLVDISVSSSMSNQDCKNMTIQKEKGYVSLSLLIIRVAKDNSWEPSLCRSEKAPLALEYLPYQQSLHLPTLEVSNQISQFFSCDSDLKPHMIEYLAEEFLQNDDSREELYRFTKLNYCFDNSKAYVLDAVNVGNETRYINHAEEKNNNVEAASELNQLFFPFGYVSECRYCSLPC